MLQLNCQRIAASQHALLCRAFAEHARTANIAGIAQQAENVACAAIKNKDHYKGTLAVVMVEGVNVNLKMVHLGMAWRFDKYSDDAALLAAQNAAKGAKRGLWSEPAPVPPWEWRSKAKK